MSYWDNKHQKIVEREPVPYPGAPGWLDIDCHCCNGIQWGGEEPIECRDCGGSGHYAKHIKTGTLAQYPGGPLIGKDGGA